MRAEIADAITNARFNERGKARVKCPLCIIITGKPDRRGSLELDAGRGRWKCWKCSAHGRMPDAFGNSAAVAQGYGYGGDEPVEEEREPVEEPSAFDPLWEGAGADAWAYRDARSYLRQRVPSEWIWREANIGACLEGKHRGRIIVPIGDPFGKWEGWVGRTWMPNSTLPYYYSKNMQRAGLLYNAAALQVETDVPCLIVEGVFDAMHVWPDAVAVLGKPDEKQLAAMIAAKRPLCVVLDGDAWEEGEALARKLTFRGARAGWIKLPPRIDPDEIEYDDLMEGAKLSLEDL